MEYLNSIDERMKEILLSYLDRNRGEFLESESAFELAEKKLELCRTRQKVLSSECDKIGAHIEILKNYEGRLFEKILSQGLNAKLKVEGTRIKELIRKYEWINRLLTDYGAVLMKDEKVLEEDSRNEFLKRIGKRLRQARKKKGMSIEEIAKKVGLTRIAFGYYEVGVRDMSTLTLYRIAAILDVSTDWLLGRNFSDDT